MRTTGILSLAAALAALAAFAGAPLPVLAQDDDPPEYRDRGEAREAYRRGYERGFERGYSKGIADGERRGMNAPPPAPPPPRIGPISVTSASYGTMSRSCNATRWVASRSNGRRNFTFEVTNNMCGDPAQGDRKTLTVAYRCGDIGKEASAVEHRTLTLDCTS